RQASARDAGRRRADGSAHSAARDGDHGGHLQSDVDRPTDAAEEGFPAPDAAQPVVPGETRHPGDLASGLRRESGRARHVAPAAGTQEPSRAGEVSHAERLPGVPSRHYPPTPHPPAPPPPPP